MPSLSDTIRFIDVASYDLGNLVRDRGQGAQTVLTGGSHWHLTISDGGVGRDVAKRVVRLTVSDGGAGVDPNSGFRVASPIDVGHGADTITPKQTVVEALVDAGRGRDAVPPFATIIKAADVGHGADAASGARLARVADGGHGGDLALTPAKFALTLSDAGFGRDALTPPVRADELAEIGHGADTIIAVRRVSLTISDGAHGGEAQASFGVRALTVVDAGHGTDAWAAAGKYGANLVDAGEGEDFVRLPAAAIDALWTNTTNAASALWRGLPFNSMVEADGTVYGAGAGGIYRMDAALDDAGTTVASEVLWDLDSFGSPQMKRLGNVYVFGATRNPASVRVVNDQGSFVYPCTPSRNPAVTRALKAETSRGLESVYYRIGVVGQFDSVEDVKLDFMPTSRRL